MIKVSTLFGLLRGQRDKRFLAALLLVICSGSLYILQGSAISLWLNEANLSLSTVVFIAAVTAVYVLHWTWLRLVGRIRLPIGYKFFRQRRSWVFLCQTGMALSVAVLSFASAVENLVAVSVCAPFVAISSEILALGLDRKYSVCLKYSNPTQDKLCR